MVLITSTGAMVLTGLAVLVAIVICVFLVRGIKKENDTLNEEKDVLVDTLLPKTRMREAVNNYATKVGNYGTFTLFYVAIDEFASLKNVVGDDTAQNVVKSIAERLVRMYKGQANIAQFEENSFLIFDKREYNYDDLQEASEKLLDIVSDNAQVL
jgi:GGDEF domain-containing protein